MFQRMELLLDKDNMDKIFKTSVLIVGVGGVGGALLEALVRLGIQNITVIDNDSFDISNLNRQLLSNRNNIGHSKVKEAELRALSINPDILFSYKEMFLNEANIDEIDFTKYDYILDCCDTMTTKYLLIDRAIKYNKKVVSCMGTGNRFDPTKLMITDISKTQNDPVAKAMRRILKEHNIKSKVPVLCSTELPVKTGNRTPGSVSLVPNVAGFIIASFVFNDIIDVGK